MAMYNKFITFLMLMFIVSYSYAQQYTPMTAAGYQYKRAKVDSTLHIPSFCGVPNLRNSTAIQGALAMDTCGNKLYQWTHTAGWSTISTNAIDSLKRSNDSIFARKSGVWVFQYKDSVGGGGTTPSLQDVATVGNYYINDFGDTLKLNSYDNNNKHPLLWVNDQYNPVNILDFSYNTGFNQNVASIKFGDSTNTLATGYIKITDKESYFKNELSQRTIIQNAPSISGSNQITYFPLMKDGTDTLATTEDVRNSAIDTSNKWVNNIYRTLGVDSIYYTIGSTTYAIKDSAGGGSSQNGRFGNDTATIVMAKIHNNSGTTLTNGKVVFMASSGTNSDAPSVRLANNKHDSTSANTFGFVSGSIANNDTGWIILSGKIEKLNTSAFANGDIIYLDSVSGNWTKTKPVAPYHMVYLGVVVKANNGNGSIFVKCQNGYELDEIHDVQITNKLNNQILVYSDTQKVWKNRNVYSIVDTSSLSNRINLKVNISDTATMLSKYLRKTDTASLSSRIDLRVKYTDTATMLTPYLRKIDTVTLSNRINLKLNISDTATMLSNYAKTNLVNTKLNISDTASMLNNYAKTNLVNTKLNISDTATMLSNYAKTNLVNTKLNISDTATMLSNYAKTNLVNTKLNINDTATMLTPYLRSNIASATYLQKSDSTTYYTKYRSDTSRTNIYNALLGKQGTLTLTTTGTSGAATLIANTLNIPQYSGGSSYTFSTGLTNSSGTVTSNLSTGVAGGQSVIGGTAASESLTISSTSNATKGKLLFGTSAYDEVNNRLGIGTTSPATKFHLSYSDNSYGQGVIIQNTNTGTTAITGMLLRNSSGTDVAQFSYYPSNYIISGQANSVSFGSVGQQKLSFGANTSASGSISQDIIFSTLGTNSTYQMQIKGNGNVQINTNTDAGYRLDVNGTARASQFFLSALNTAPASATATGTTGEIRIDANYIYICTATNTWKRVAIATW